MKRTLTTPSLSDGNRLYLYNLLREQLGCGKQTFLPAVEEALAADAMTAEDLGFASTRDLLEALGDIVELKVFKGGRVYATLVAKPEWDAALEAAAKPDPAEAKAAKGNKPWKRKKGAKGKALKPQRPRRVKREEPAAEEVAAPVEAAEPKVSEPVQDAPAEDAPPVVELRNGVFSLEDELVEEPEQLDEPAPAAEAEAPVPAPAPDLSAIALTVTYDPYTGNDEETLLVAEVAEPADATAEEPVQEPVAGAPAVDLEPVAESVPATGETAAEDSAQQVDGVASDDACEVASEPSITFTITYDPSAEVVSDFVGETVHEDGAATSAVEHDEHVPCMDAASDSAVAEKAVLGNAVAQGASVHPKAEPAHQSTAASISPAPADAALPHTAPSAQALASYPRDFLREATIPSEVLVTLTHVMPLHANAPQVLTEDFRTARGMATVLGTRAQATFPLRYAGADGTPVLVSIKRASRSGWTVTEVLNVDEATLTQSGMDGLPLMELDAIGRARVAAAQMAYLDEAALEALAAKAYPQVWSTGALRDHLALVVAGAAPLEDGQLATGLFDADGEPLTASIERTDDDIPWCLV